ncbi:hypothetical protein ACJX0J_007270, partial [Zea mays]
MSATWAHNTIYFKCVHTSDHQYPEQQSNLRVIHQINKQVTSSKLCFSLKLHINAEDKFIDYLFTIMDFIEGISTGSSFLKGITATELDTYPLNHRKRKQIVEQLLKHREALFLGEEVLRYWWFMEILFGLHQVMCFQKNTTVRTKLIINRDTQMKFIFLLY